MIARNVIAAAIALVAIGSAVNCSASNASVDSAGSPGDAASHSDAGNAGSDEASVFLFPGAVDSSRGVILVHGSANLPAFRLCFGKVSGGSLVTTPVSSALRPLPDRHLMPDSNVVGVEIGSAVRLNPLGDPNVGVLADDHVFAIPEVYVRPGAGADLPCSARICPTAFSSTCLQKDPPLPGQRGYYDLGVLPTGAIEENVKLLVLHGCVPGAADAGVSSCGAGYDPVAGNMKLDLLQLTAYKTEKPEQFFVQVAQLSEAVVGTTLAVKYGDLSNPASREDLGLPADFGQIAPPSNPTIFYLDRSAPGIYASRGFEVRVGAQTFNKSLAEIQLVTAPQALPDDLYSSKSNFVLLLLGDPSLANAQGQALSTMTDPGLLLHLLVVPVGQPVDPDAGIDAGAD